MITRSLVTFYLDFYNVVHVGLHLEDHLESTVGPACTSNYLFSKTDSAAHLTCVMTLLCEQAPYHP